MTDWIMILKKWKEKGETIENETIDVKDFNDKLIEHIFNKFKDNLKEDEQIDNKIEQIDNTKEKFTNLFNEYFNENPKYFTKQYYLGDDKQIGNKSDVRMRRTKAFEKRKRKTNTRKV